MLEISDQSLTHEGVKGNPNQYHHDFYQDHKPTYDFVEDIYNTSALDQAVNRNLLATYKMLRSFMNVEVVRIYQSIARLKD